MGTSAVQNMYQALATYLGPLFLAALAVYVVWWGYEMLFGRAPMTAGAFVWKFGRAFIVYSFIVSWATYQPLIVTPLVKAPDAVAAVVCEAAGGEGCGGDGASMGQGLSDIWHAGMSGASAIVAQGGVWAMFLYLLAGGVLIFTLILCATAAVILIMGKMTLFILLGIGPIVLCCALFRLTSGVVDGWMRSLATYAVLPILVYTVLGLMTSLLGNTVSALQSGAPSLETVMPFIFMCIATTLLLREVVGLAAAIAGGGPRIDQSTSVALLGTRALALAGAHGAYRGGQYALSRWAGGGPMTVTDGTADKAIVTSAASNSRK
ncbi:type IV secretion protein [Xaviernesmea oryzae]|uniref:Type IV secretion protein n=2 Tax=Xaviernesmea oryzae TaxID=464029 RepID=A0A1Q9AW80_9HYPH|nr:type IV secretion protein [Xaviernesmea oryzae]